MNFQRFFLKKKGKSVFVLVYYNEIIFLNNKLSKMVFLDANKTTFHFK